MLLDLSENWGFSDGSVIKHLPTKAGNARDACLLSRLGRLLGVGSANFIPMYLPGKSHGQRSLVGYSPWGHKESDMAK